MLRPTGLEKIPAVCLHAPIDCSLDVALECEFPGVKQVFDRAPGCHPNSFLAAVPLEAFPGVLKPFLLFFQ
jgi:hypothetical protein